MTLALTLKPLADAIDAAAQQYSAGMAQRDAVRSGDDGTAVLHQYGTDDAREELRDYCHTILATPAGAAALLELLTRGSALQQWARERIALAASDVAEELSGPCPTDDELREQYGNLLQLFAGLKAAAEGLKVPEEDVRALLPQWTKATERGRARKDGTVGLSLAVRERPKAKREGTSALALYYSDGERVDGASLYHQCKTVGLSVSEVTGAYSDGLREFAGFVIGTD